MPNRIRRTAAWRAWALSAVLLLASCASLRPPPSPDSLAYAGRFSVSWRDAATTHPQQRASGRFTLRVDGAYSELEISSPLGQTLALAQVGPQLASLEAADGTRWRSERPDTLTEQAFGWPAPLAQLPRWLAISQPSEFEEAGWQVLIEAQQDGQPRRLTLRWTAGPTGDRARAVELRLLVDAATAGKR